MAQAALGVSDRELRQPPTGGSAITFPRRAPSPCALRLPCSRVRAMDAEMIVVGAGSAGAVIASRVTERDDREVLLIEAGPDYPDGNLPPDLRDGTRNSMILHDWDLRFRPTPRQN